MQENTYTALGMCRLTILWCIVQLCIALLKDSVSPLSGTRLYCLVI